MGKVEKVSIALTEELAETVRAAVASGDFASSSEVVRAALREWRDRRERARAEVERIRQLWQEGIESGPGRFASVEEMKAEARRRHEAESR
jgi:antitoxin ParD1/3/4